MGWVTASQFIGSSGSRVLIALFAAAAAGLLVVAITVLLDRRQAEVERQLAGYKIADPNAVAHTDASETAVVQQAMAMATRVAERAGMLTKTEELLERADVPVRAAELLFYVPAFAVVGFLLLAVLVGPLAGIVAAAVVAVGPFAYLNYRDRQRKSGFERQLPDTLTLLASSLRAGFSLMQGLEAVAQEITDPMRKELQRVFTEVRLGRSIEEALGDAADRMDSDDLRWTVMAIRIQREVGGNLAVLLDTVADTMVKRERVRRELKALTAEGRLSAIVLSLITPVLALAIWAIQPSYLEPLTHDFFGIMGLIVAGMLSVVGWFWLQKIVDIEV
jgi:tight adherence protein B